MTEIDYGRLDALEAILGGRAAINDAYLKGKSYGAPDSVASIGSALSESGATGDTLAVRSDGTVHRYKPVAINAATFGAGVVADLQSLAFTSVSGTTLNYVSALADVGKTVCIPGAGRDDGAGIKDGFTTTITGVVPGVSATLANSVPTAVSTGTNRFFSIGTDNTTALRAFIAALGSTFGSGFVPGGDYLHTGDLAFGPALATNRGLEFAGAGAGSFGASAGHGATRFFYVGPVNSAVNGTGISAMHATSTSGIYGLKQHGFSIVVQRALSISTTVNGAGQTINNVGANLVLASTAGLPTGGGRFTLAGAPFEVSYTGITGNTVNGARMTSGTFTTAGGEAVRLIVAGWYWDAVNQSEASDIIVNGYVDNNNNNTSANQGHGCWYNNPAAGQAAIRRVHARVFNGPDSEGWRIGTCTAGWGAPGNTGNLTVEACSVVNCHHGWHFNGRVGGPFDGSAFSALKAVAANSTGRGMWIELTFSGNTWNSPHVEGYQQGIYFDGAVGNTINSPLLSYGYGTAGDGSTALNFTNSAAANIVNGAVWVGYGSGGWDYVAQYASNTSGNRVTARALPSFPNAGTKQALMGGTGNRFIDLANPWDSPSVVVVTSTNATWPIPAGVQTLRITAIGGGGGAGGGGSPGSGSPVTTQVGGAGASAGLSSSQVVQVGNNTTLAITIGNGGSGGNGATAGAVGAGQPGSNGSPGQDTTVTGTGISVTAKKGNKGRGAAANSTATVAADAWGQSIQAIGITAGVTPSVGGPAASTGGQGGGDPLGPSSGGASAGNASTATLGGVGGNAGSLIAGGAATSTQTATATGGDGADAAAGQYGAPGGGGGGGAWNGGTAGAGGKGGTGQKGVVIIEYLG